MTDVVVGVDLGGTHARAGALPVGGRGARLLGFAKLSSRSGCGVDAVLDAVAACARAAAGPHRVRGVGVGLPGPLDAEAGVVHEAPNLGADFRAVPVARLLRKRLGVPVLIENDANAVAVGEHRFGAGRGARALLCVTLGTGVGGGLVLDGRLWRGASGSAGEIGHVPIRPDGLQCACGRHGCLEATVSTRRILARTRAAARAGAAPRLAKLLRTGSSVQVRDVARAARRGDPGLVRIFEDVGRDLGFALAGVVQVLNPDCLVIGGGIAGAWPLFVGRLESELRVRAFEAARAPLRLRRGRLGDRAGILGAATLLEQRAEPARERREAPRHHPRGAGP